MPRRTTSLRSPGRAASRPAASLDATLAALADPTRRRVVEALRQRPRRAGELAAAFRTSAPAMSRHLRVLRTRGLVEEERDAGDARARVYRLRPEPFRDLQSWLAELEAFWSEQLRAFRRHAERRPKGGPS
jgi:DNA-binding transcriptional ArsR family regulator